MPFAALARVCFATIIGAFVSLLIAANWPDPNDELAGAVIGIVGTYAGFITGVIWADVAETRRHR